MSQYDANAGGMSDFGHSGPKQTNVLGIVGFILAFCTGPIGLIISLIALTKRPRGFAIAGVIVGLIMTIAMAFIAFSVWAGGSVIAMTVQMTMQHQNITAEIDAYKSANNGALPPDLNALNLPTEARTDYWGTEWRLEISADGTTYTLVSAGIDRVFDTSDDIRLAEGISQRQLSEAFETPAEQMMQERFGGGSGTTGGTQPLLPDDNDSNNGSDQ